MSKDFRANVISFLNQYQGGFKDAIMKNEFNSTLLRNEASGRYNTTLNEMRAKKKMIEKAKTLVDVITNS